MTAGARPRETSTVDQLVFRLACTTNVTEMGIAAGSLDTDLVHEDQWWHPLRQHIRLQRSPNPSLTCRASLFLFEYDDGTACLLRRSCRGETGRNYSSSVGGFRLNSLYAQ